MQNTRYLLNERGWVMTAREIIAEIFPNDEFGTRVPSDRSGETHIGPVYVCYLTSADAKAKSKGERKGMYMRAWAICPHCLREFSASRLNQHLRGCKGSN